MKKIALILLVLLFACVYANDFRFYADYASFYDSDKAFVEIYYMFPRFEMGRQDIGNGQSEAKYIVAMNVFSGEKKILSKTLTIDDIAADTDTIRSTDFIPEVYGFHLDEGKYKLHTMVRDMVSGKISQRDTFLDIPSYSLNSLTISDIEIASFVGKTQKENKFTKLGAYDIIPQANPEFDIYLGGFYSYFEVYKLSPGGDYTFQSSIRDIDGKIILSNQEITSPAPGKYDVLVDYMDIEDLPGGIYNYHVEVQDKISKERAVASKKIYMIRENEINIELYDEYVDYQKTQLDSMYRILNPLMTTQEIKNYKNASIDGKRHLFIEFWKRRDTNMETPINEYYMEIMRRIDFAREHYTYMGKGPRSDRGRVLLKYGYPSDIERSGMSSYRKDYEIWVYEGMRGKIQFVFCDTQGRGYLELIHSDMEGEINNESWQEIITGGAKNY